MKEWEEYLTVLTERSIFEDKFNVLGLYLKLSNQAANWINNNEYGIKSGDSFQVECETGDFLVFEFYKDTTELKLLNKDDGYETILIDKKDSALKEYRAVYAIEHAFKTSKLGLGVLFSRDMYTICSNLKVGDTISFEEKNSYCCKENKNGCLTLTKVFTGDNTNITTKTFLNAENVKVDYSSIGGRQNFFSKNRITASGAIVTKITSETKAQEFLNKLHSQIPKGTTKRLKWGPISLLAKKRRGFNEKGLIWYMDGKKIDVSVVKMMLGFFLNAPTTTEFVHKEQTVKKEFDDLQMLNHIKNLCAETKYEKIYNDLVGYVDTCKSDLMVNIHTFAPDENGNFLAKSFAFKNVDGRTSVFELSYEDNNFNNDAIQIREILVEDFVDFCNKVNANNKTYFIGKAREEIKVTEKIHTLTESQELEAKRRAEEERQKSPIINNNNIHTELTLDDLIEMHKTTKKEDSYDVLEAAKNFFDVDR